MAVRRRDGIPGFIVKLVVTVVATFFIAIDFSKIAEFFKRWIPAEKESIINKGVDYIKNVIFIYIRSYSLLFLMIFVELSTGLLILRIPYAVLLVLGIADIDILPVLGTGGILLPWAVVLLVIGNVPLAAGILGAWNCRDDCFNSKIILCNGIESCFTSWIKFIITSCTKPIKSISEHGEK